MQVEKTSIAGVMLITPRRFDDPRGHFAETYSATRYAAAGIATAFVQDNQSYSRPRGVVRGLHYQIAPYAQAKLVRVLRGAVLDVVVDLRRDSATFGRHLAVELTAESGRQLFVPIGLAHGFCTLAPETEVFYKVSADYAPAQERGLLWNDAALGIDWPISATDALLSDKDLRNPCWSDVVDWF